MTDLSACLQSLPIELLRNIACKLPCSSVLDLIIVNRKLHAACNDRLIFRYIAENANYLTEVHLPWDEASIALDEASLSDTARVAYAIEKAHKWSMQKETEWDDNRTASLDNDISHWLPHLTALRHPFALGNSPQILLGPWLQSGTYIRGRNMSDSNDLSHVFIERFIITSFCLTTLTLKTNYRESKVAPGIPEEFAETIHSLRYISSVDRTEMMHLLVTMIDEINNLDQSHGAILLTIILLILWTNRYQLTCPMPYIENIPFHSFMNIPPIYRNTGKSFSKCHLHTMTSAEFLTGDWSGFYSDHRGYITLDPPMWNINLVARPSDREVFPEIKTIIYGASSGGRDGIGDFRLDGTVSTEGVVRMHKTYTGRQFSWAWDGRLTPFGIVGTWGDEHDVLSRHGMSAGYFWIWKKEWAKLPTQTLE